METVLFNNVLDYYGEQPPVISQIDSISKHSSEPPIVRTKTIDMDTVKSKYPNLIEYIGSIKSKENESLLNAPETINKSLLNLKQKGAKKEEAFDYLHNIDDLDTKEYLIRLAKRESNFDPNVKNQLGYVGLYQFGDSAIEEMAKQGVISKMSKDEFRYSDLETQTKAAIGLANYNWKQIKGLAENKLGSTINGVKVTKRGLMAASHLVGAGTVKTWLRNNGQMPLDKKSDANGTTIESYMKMYKS